jgi:ParB family chromosome partitioning protein
MNNSAKNVHLTSLDEIFCLDDKDNSIKKDGVHEILLSDLHPFKNHPFQVRDDEEMQKLVDSIRENGVLSPAIARTRTEGGYEIIAGHRRHHACELAGLPTMPVLIRNLDNDQATILMVDSNLQRENILPSERAFAFKLKLEAMKRQGKRTDLTSAQLGPKSNGKTSAELLGEQVGESRNQIKRYVRLTELIQPLLKKVDEKEIAFNSAVELSYLTEDKQTVLLDIIERESAPSLSQAQRLKQFSQEGKLTTASMEAIMTEEKTVPQKVTLPGTKLKKYFPTTYTPAQMEGIIIYLLEDWKSKGGDSVG